MKNWIVDNCLIVMIIIISLLFITGGLFSLSDFDINYVESQKKYDDLFKKYGAEFGNDWIDLKIQSYIESTLNPKALSWVGAKGLMQIMPDTLKDIRKQIPVDDLNNPGDNIKAGSYYMQWIRKYIKQRYGSTDIILSLIAYNHGIGNLNHIIRRSNSLEIIKIKMYLPDETKGYITKFIFIKKQIIERYKKQIELKNEFLIKSYISRVYKLFILTDHIEKIIVYRRD
jgi:hypothetical protein